MRQRGMTVTICVMLLAVLHAGTVDAASFATTAFAGQWQAGEALVPNFWGPLATAGTGRYEYYRQSPSGQRLVQYFDKGRMELTNPATGVVTNGLLVTEMIRGRIQVGDDAFVSRPPPNIPIAGDPGNAGPTYAALSANAAVLFAPAPMQTGPIVAPLVFATGNVAPSGAIAGSGVTDVGGYDAPTRHNVAAVFADYRSRAGLGTIGLAISEPFQATFTVGAVPQNVMVQIFERRVLTYTARNAPAFQVEMGNVGQHYAQWRYPPGSPPVQPPIG